MGFKDIFKDWSEKRKEDKNEFQSMERDLRLRKLLEEKQKTPHQKEFEFYKREKHREQLKKVVEFQRKQRDKKMRKLSSPFNNPPVNNNNDLIRKNVKWA